MTSFDKWLTTLAAEVAKDDATAERQVETTLEQRIGISLAQARAAECRHIAGQLMINMNGHPMASQLAGWLSERSHKLENLALGMCHKWPPDTPEAPPQNLVKLT